jgi:hypothetical protein
MRHAWTVLAEKVIIDQATNNISIDVLEQVAVDLPPLPEGKRGYLVPAKLEVVTLWYRSDTLVPERGRMRLRLLGPAGDDIHTIETDIDLTQHQRLRARAAMMALPVSITGVYLFVVELAHGQAWVEVARVPLEIAIRTSTALPTTQH